MSEDATTLMARVESPGRAYPMVLERMLFAAAVVGFVVLQPTAMDAIDSPSWLSYVVGWCGLPIGLMLLTEFLGRVLQRVW